jgi:hypothetical protein
VGAKKHAAREWMNHGLRPLPSLVPYEGGWEAGSSSRWLFLRRWLLIAPRELVRWRLPIGDGAQDARPFRGRGEARRLGKDNQWPPSTAVAATLCGRLGGGLLLTVVSLVCVL